MRQFLIWRTGLARSAMGVLLFLGILLPVVRSQTKDDSKPPQQAPEFYDDPKFTVSDVADPTSLGGHGSNATAATRQSLAEDVQAIKGQSTSAPTNKRDLENALQRDPVNAHLHHQLAELEEHSGNAIAAVKQFQRAAELDPSEQNLLDWGSELVAHGAAEPAGEVFTKGHRLFPRSVRMLVAMGTAWYLRGSYEQAINSLCDASDLEPNNATPHLFLGKILVAENVSGERVRNTLKRFASLQPENANANYLYALSLWKQPSSSQDARVVSQVEALLQKSMRLDPQFGPAYLQLGSVYSEKQDFPNALLTLKKASELDPNSEQAHYRLSQVYRHLGQTENAQREMHAYREAARQHQERMAREQHSKQVFVYAPQAADRPDVPK